MQPVDRALGAETTTPQQRCTLAETSTLRLHGRDATLFQLIHLNLGDARFKQIRLRASWKVISLVAKVFR
jgi:hypothetical protein